MPEHTEQPRWALFLERPLSPAEYAALGDYDRRHVYAVGEARLIPAEEAGAVPLGLYAMRPVTEQFGRAVREDAFCGECLRAVRLALGLQNVHHYRHQSDTTGCAASSAESALHLNAKFALAHALRSVGTEPDDVRLRFRCADSGRPAPSPCEAERIQPWGLLWDDVQVEYRADPVRPDIALLRGGTPVAAVEVLVTHAVDGVKAARLAELGLRWIEVRAEAVYEDWGRPWQPWAPLEAERTDGTYPDAWRCEPHRQLREQERMRELNAPRVAAVRAVRVHRRPDALDQGNLFRVHLVEERQDGEVRSIRLDAQRGSRGHALTRAVPLARGADPVAAAVEVYDAWARSETERAQAPVESPMAWVAPSALPRELDGARFPTLLRWDPDLRRHVAPPDHPGVTWPLPATARLVFAPGQPQAWTTNVAMRGLQANALFGRTWLTACREDERRMAHAIWWYNGSDWEEIASGRGMPLPAGFSDADVPALADRMLAALQAGLAADPAERIGQWQAARYVRSALEPIARREESRVQAALADQRADLAAYVSHALPDAITNLGYTLEAGDPAHGQPDLILRSRSGPGDYAVGLCFTQATAAWNPRLHAPQHRRFTYWICLESDYRARVAGVETDHPERENRIPAGVLIPARLVGGSWEVALGGERTDALLRHIKRLAFAVARYEGRNAARADYMPKWFTLAQSRPPDVTPDPVPETLTPAMFAPGNPVHLHLRNRPARVAVDRFHSLSYAADGSLWADVDLGSTGGEHTVAAPTSRTRASVNLSALQPPRRASPVGPGPVTAPEMPGLLDPALDCWATARMSIDVWPFAAFLTSGRTVFFESIVGVSLGPSGSGQELMLEVSAAEESDASWDGSSPAPRRIALRDIVVLYEVADT